MKILILSQYFWPENFIINDLAKEMAKRGHHITVATGRPNYPDGVIKEGYDRKGVIYDTFCNDIEIIRVPIIPRKSSKFLDLAINYLSFVISATWHLRSILANRKFDAIFVFGVSPITSALPAIWLRKKMNSKVILWVQDLWPNSISATGHIRNKTLLNTIEVVVRYIYKRSDLILVPSSAFRSEIQKIAPNQQVEFFPNFAPKDSDISHQPFPEELDHYFKNYFCCVFAGNLGKAQSLETIIQAGEHLRAIDNIRLIVIGDGSEEVWMQETINRKNLTNIIMTGRLPSNMMPKIFAAADALLITLRPDQTLDKTIPSKLQNYMKSGRPIIGAVNGECASQIINSNAGEVVPAGDSKRLSSMIEKFRKLSRDDRNAMGKSAQKYFSENYEIDTIIDRLIELITLKTNEAGR